MLGHWRTGRHRRSRLGLGAVALVAVVSVVGHGLAAGEKASAIAGYTGTCPEVRIPAERLDGCDRPGPGARAAVAGRGRTPGTIVLTWRTPRRTAQTRVVRDGQLLDVLDAGARRFVDHERWPGSIQRYRLLFFDRDGHRLGSASRRVRLRSGSPAAARPFAATSFFNRPIPADVGVDPASALLVATSLAPFQAAANLGNSALWGIPIAYAQSTSRRQRVRCTQFWCDRRVPAAAIPASAHPSTGADGHLAVIAPSGRSALELWHGDVRAGAWSAGVRLISDLEGSGRNCTPPQRCPGTVAAGFSALAGLVRPEEIASGRIDHALAITVPVVRADYAACPAVSTDGTARVPGAIAEGARLQLDPGFDVDRSQLPRWQRIVARALQRYGAYVVDYGGSVSIRAQSDLLRGYDAWRRAGVPSGPENASLRDLPLDRLRVLASTRCAGAWPGSR